MSLVRRFANDKNKTAQVAAGVEWLDAGLIFALIHCYAPKVRKCEEPKTKTEIF